MFLHVQLHLTSLPVDGISVMREGDRDGSGIWRYAVLLLRLRLMGMGEAHGVWIGVGASWREWAGCFMGFIFYVYVVYFGGPWGPEGKE
jgi:hypothetical protein